MVLDFELSATVRRLEAATTAADVVGPDDADRPKRVRGMKLLLHPDRWVTRDSDVQRVAGHAFARLQELLAEEKTKVSGVFDVTTKRRTYTVQGAAAFKGTVANLYPVTYVRDPADPPHAVLKTGLLKLPRSVRDNDLIVAEAQTLKKIWATGRKRTAYFPRIEDQFVQRDRTSRVDRRAVVVRRLDGFVSLTEVRNAYPSGLDPRDLAWMWRRCLAAVSLLSELDIVHGALTPDHVLIHPQEHGVQLCGFTSSVPAGGTIKVLGGPKRFYPPEVLAKEEATHATDLYMLHVTMGSMLEASAPRQFRSFIKGVCFERPAVRPQDSRALLGEFDELLGRMYGARKFRVFPPMPTVT